MPTEQSPWQKDIRRIRSKIKALIIVNVIFLFCISAELTPFVCMYIDSYLPVYDRQLLPKTYIAAVSLVNILIVCILILYFKIWLKQRKITGKAFPKLFPDHTGLLCVTVQLLKKSIWQMIIAIIVLLFFIYIAVAMYNFNSKSRRNHALAEAKSIYNAAITYQNDQYNNGKQYEFETAILNRTEERENNPLHKGICQYLFNADNYNYAIVCDEYSNVVGAFMSYYPISEKDLEYPKENKRTSFFYSTLISDKQDNITHY